MHGEFMASIFVKAPVSCISKAVAVLFRRCHIYACTMSKMLSNCHSLHKVSVYSRGLLMM